MTALITTDASSNMCGINGRIHPESPKLPLRCAVCFRDYSDGRLYLDMVNHLVEEQQSVADIVEQHLSLKLEESNYTNPRELCTICNVCWDVVYKFHVFYRMVQSYQTKHKINMENRAGVIITPNGEECAERSVTHNTEFVTIKHEAEELLDDANDRDEENDPIASLSATNKSVSTNPDGSSDNDNVAHPQRTPANRVKETQMAEDREILDFYKQIVCEMCDPQRMAEGKAAIEYSTLKELNRHMRTEHNVGYAKLRCPVCTNKYRTRVQLLQHKEMHLNPESFRCGICQEVHHNMDDHVKKRHGERMFCCVECGKKFVLRSRLAVHMRMAHAPRDVMCEQCNKPFSKYTIDEHKRAVHLASFICEYCTKTFKSRFWLKRHMETHTDNGRNIHAATCTVCSTVVKDKYILVGHMRRMHSEQPAVNCESCGKSFKSKHNLNKHLRTVCTDVSFPCAVCGKQFKQKIKLNEHMTTHTGIALYVCNFCPQTFKYESHFYNHRKKVHHKQWLEMQQHRNEGQRQRIQLIRSKC